MKVSEVTNLIRERIIAGNYIKDPIVSLEFLNFKYTVLGAVANNGTFTVDGDRITLIDAIARAGDLNAKARIDRVAVIREIGGERKMFMHDLRSMGHRVCRAEIPEEGQRRPWLADRNDFAFGRNGRMLDFVGNKIRKGTQVNLNFKNS